ncbi:hypothetical protein INS49_009393 [Diaporthe citri]|uniref:uncharacterized protein n=1 Tax=Diaporthe citri TaxID=83186 RepID=UPI001C8099D9|nr:uncharacterized protein INS49_009393 [Diaporthe citri]KAG6361169.1 hypothetical protein INS49_009393 [Diaporthe citri]
MRILRPKLHGHADKRTVGTAGDIDEHTEEVKLAQSVVASFEKDLHDQTKPDRAAQLLRKLLSKTEDAEDQECLKDLVVSDPRDDKMRIEETKGGLWSRSYVWILEDHDFHRWRENGQNKPFWITGAPGKGKTTMLCGIINELSKQLGTNVSYFLCQGTDKRINTGTGVLRGLLFLLCNQQHSLISHIRSKYDDAGGKLFEDPNAWFALSGILDNMLGDPGLRHTCLIVDALDECLPDSRQLLVRLIVRMANAYPTVKWIVSSRELDEFKRHLPEATHLSLESRGESIFEAVNAYIDFKVTKLGLGERSLGLSKVKTIADELKEKSEGTFLWIALVCKVLESAHEYEFMEILQEMPTGLNELYGKLIQDIKALPRKRPTHCQSVLRAVAVAFRPLTLEELEELADLPKDDHYSHGEHVNSVALTLDGRRIASGSDDDTVKIWDAETGGHIRTLELGEDILVVTFSPDGCHLSVAVITRSFVIYDAESGGTVSTCGLPDNDDLNTHIVDKRFALSLGARYIATRREQAVNIQSSADSKAVCMLRGHEGYVTSLAFSPKDCHIVASSSYETIKLWDVMIGAEISTVNP